MAKGADRSMTNPRPFTKRAVASMPGARIPYWRIAPARSVRELHVREKRCADLPRYTIHFDVAHFASIGDHFYGRAVVRSRAAPYRLYGGTR
jgi:hypothetical protein